MDQKVKLNFNSEGYSPKDLYFAQEAQQKLISGISKLASAVKSTLGPRGNTVLLESSAHTRGVTVTKDGVTVAKAIDLLDPVENLAARLLKEAADRTATDAGDATTTAIVLAEAIISSGVDYLSTEVNKTRVLRNIELLSRDVVDYVRSESTSLVDNMHMLSDVATISANNDPHIGGLIADMFKTVGPNGVVSVARSKTNRTYSEATEGIRMQRGATSQVFLTDVRKGEWRHENVRVMVADMELTNVNAMVGVFQDVVVNNYPLLIIAPVSQNFLNTIAANVIRNGLKICIVEPPSFGYRRHDLMADIAVALGANLFSEQTGSDVTMMVPTDLGFAPSVTVSETETVITRSEESDELAVRLSQLKEALAEAQTKDDKDTLLERIAFLSGGIGTIYVGGKTDIEQKELYDRVDDAVCAVRSALAEGVVYGGGKALFNAANQMFDDYQSHDMKNEELTCAINILFDALREPMFTILRNAGMEEKIDSFVRKGDGTPAKTYGVDATNGQMVELMSGGIIDPVKVIRCALENAVSVATTILSTNAVVVNAREI